MNNKMNIIRTKVYIAAALFSQAEQNFNLMLANKLEKYVEVFLPQRDVGLISEMTDNGLTMNAAYELIFKENIQGINDSNIVLAILDGKCVDEGVAFEMGYAFSRGVKCIGLQTDIRKNSDYKNNIMIDKSIDNVFTNIDDLIKWITCTSSVLGIIAK